MALWSLEHRDVLSQKCNVKGYMWGRACQIWILYFHLTERETKNILVAQARTECHLSYMGRMGKEEHGLDSAGS